MKKTKRIRTVAACLLMIGALSVPMNTPLANLVPGASSYSVQSTVEAKSVLTKKQAKKKLKKWLKKKGLLKKKLKIAYDRKEKKSYVFWAYYDEGDHTSTQNYYYVNYNTGKIKAEF